MPSSKRSSREGWLVIAVAERVKKPGGVNLEVGNTICRELNFDGTSLGSPSKPDHIPRSCSSVLRQQDESITRYNNWLRPSQPIQDKMAELTSRSNFLQCHIQFSTNEPLYLNTLPRTSTNHLGL